MLELNNLDEIRGNTVAIYSIKTLLRGNNFPRFSILSGREGVGKSSVAKIIAKEISKDDRIITYNMGLNVNMDEVQQQVFTLAPVSPKAFIFEEIQGLNKENQTALLNMIDTQPNNVYVICTTTAINKISRALKSRATSWEFKVLDKAQLEGLLSDYLNEQGKVLSKEAKELLIRSSFGIPRDLLKNTDFALSGDFTSSDLGTLLGQVPDDNLFALFLSVASDDGGNVALILNGLINQVTGDKLYQIRDFCTRYLLASLSRNYNSIGRDIVFTLDSIYTTEKKEKVTNALIKLTADNLVLGLLSLNMNLGRVNNASLLGSQKHLAQQNEAVQTVRKSNTETKETSKTGLSSLDLLDLKL